MNNEGSERPPKGGDQKSIALAIYWLWLYIVEEKLGITDLSQIDPITFSIWLMGRSAPSLGQKRNISTAVRKFLGKKLLPLHGIRPEFSEAIIPSIETYFSTLKNISELSSIENDELRNILWIAKGTFMCTSFTGVSIAELLRSEICNVNELDKKCGIDKYYDFTVSVTHSDCIKKASTPSCKHVQLKGIPSFYFEVIEIFLQKIKLLIPIAERAKFISKVQYIITKQNTAKGYNLRQLRAMYSGIHGYIKPDDGCRHETR